MSGNGKWKDGRQDDDASANSRMARHAAIAVDGGRLSAGV